MSDLISIVLPVYNGERFLAESIESILSQTWRDWELIIMDDCSTDSTAAIAQAFCESDPRVFYYRNETNLRLPENLNRGFEHARGSFLTWTSDDNVYLPQALEKMHDRLVETGRDFVFASCRVMDEDGKDYEYIMVNGSSPKRLVGRNTVGACFLYTRRAYEVTGKYDPDLRLVEDFDYWQRMAAVFPPEPMEEILYRYRMHGSSLTSTMAQDAFQQTLEKMLMKNRPLFEPMDWESRYYYYSGLASCRKARKEKDPDAFRFRYYSLMYLLRRRIPDKVRRSLHVGA